jgi:hypothetical protein
MSHSEYRWKDKESKEYYDELQELLKYYTKKDTGLPQYRVYGE